MVASFKGYTSFDGDREQAKDKIEQLKSQFASQIDALNVDEILKNCSENQRKQENVTEKISKLDLYRDLGEDSILLNLVQIFLRDLTAAITERMS